MTSIELTKTAVVTRLLCSGAAMVAVGCTAPAAKEHSEGELTKKEVRKKAKADWPSDLCEDYGWYGDGVCDDFCPDPDPDCEGDYSPCDGLACGDECDPCPPHDPDCTHAYGIYTCDADGSCTLDSAECEDECFGAWRDEEGTCRSGTDGVLPDHCCDDEGDDDVCCEEAEDCRDEAGCPPGSVCEVECVDGQCVDPFTDEVLSCESPIDAGEAPLCSNDCRWSHDGICDDGGEGSDYDLCELGSDCADCGMRDAA